MSRFLRFCTTAMLIGTLTVSISSHAACIQYLHKLATSAIRSLGLSYPAPVETLESRLQRADFALKLATNELKRMEPLPADKRAFVHSEALSLMIPTLVKVLDDITPEIAPANDQFTHSQEARILKLKVEAAQKVAARQVSLSWMLKFIPEVQAVNRNEPQPNSNIQRMTEDAVESDGCLPWPVFARLTIYDFNRLDVRIRPLGIAFEDLVYDAAPGTPEEFLIHDLSNHSVPRFIVQNFSEFHTFRDKLFKRFDSQSVLRKELLHFIWFDSTHENFDVYDYFMRLRQFRFVDRILIDYKIGIFLSRLKNKDDLGKDASITLKALSNEQLETETRAAYEQFTTFFDEAVEMRRLHLGWPRH